MLKYPFEKLVNGKLVPDDYCDACGQRVANHETEAGLLCDQCAIDIHGEQEEDGKRYEQQYRLQQ
jgi:hypothetical protein